MNRATCHHCHSMCLQPLNWTGGSNMESVTVHKKGCLTKSNLNRHKHDRTEHYDLIAYNLLSNRDKCYRALLNITFSTAGTNCFGTLAPNVSSENSNLV